MRDCRVESSIFRIAASGLRIGNASGRVFPKKIPTQELLAPAQKIYASVDYRGQGGEFNVALIDCAAAARPLRARIVENAPWQIRAKRAGLSQREIALLLGLAENTVSLQLRGRWQSGVPMYVQALIVAWENMTQSGRDAFRSEMQKLRDEMIPGKRGD